MTAIQKAVARLIAKHGTVRNAASAVGIHYSRLCKLGTGKISDGVGPETLRKLGLVRETRVKKAK